MNLYESTPRVAFRFERWDVLFQIAVTLLSAARGRNSRQNHQQCFQTGTTTGPTTKAMPSSTHHCTRYKLLKGVRLNEQCFQATLHAMAWHTQTHLHDFLIPAATTRKQFLTRHGTPRARYCQSSLMLKLHMFCATISQVSCKIVYDHGIDKNY